MAKAITVNSGTDLEYLLVENNLRIPDNQRNFAWKLNQAEDLWNDLFESFKTENQIFLGTFVFYLEEVDEENILELFGRNRKFTNKTTIHNIVDGQQRITTLYILLLSIRAAMKDKGSSSKFAVIQERMGLVDTFYPKYITSPMIQRVFQEMHDLIGTDDGYSKAHTIGEEMIGGVQKKGDNLFEILRKKYTPESDDSKDTKKNKKEMLDQIKFIQPIFNLFFGKINELETTEMYTFFTAVWKIQYSIVECTAIADAFDIFERVNNRGTPLGITDLLKNHLFGLTHKEENTEIIGLKDRWDNLLIDLPIRKKIKGELVEEETTMNAAKSKKWITNFHPTIMPHTRDQKEIMRGLRGQCNGNKNAEKFLTKLEDFSEFFKFYENENIKGNKSSEHERFQNSKNIINHFIPEMHDDMDLVQCHKALSGIQHYSIKQAIPLIYCVLRKYKDLKVWGLQNKTLQTREIIPLFLKSLESFHFISTYIVGMKANRYEDIYQTYPTRIQNTSIPADFFREIESLFEKLNDVVIKQNVKTLFKANFRELNYDANAAKITYILKRMAYKNPKVQNTERNDITSATM